jgi:hypothetical protein
LGIGDFCVSTFQFGYWGFLCFNFPDWVLGIVVLITTGSYLQLFMYTKT